MRILVLLLALVALLLAQAVIGTIIGGHEPTAWATAVSSLVMFAILAVVAKN